MENVPPKKHGIGKGLMTVWHATNANKGDFPMNLNFLCRSTALGTLSSSAGSKETLPKDSSPRKPVSVSSESYFTYLGVHFCSKLKNKMFNVFMLYFFP